MCAGFAYWDRNGSTPGAGGTSPNGTWGSTSWSPSSAGASATVGWVDDDTAFFSAGSDAAGNYTITVSAAHRVGDVYIEEGNVTFAGTGSLELVNSANIYVPNGQKATFTVQLSGSAGLAKGDLGELSLTGNNTFTGPVSVNGGILSFNAPAALGTGTDAIIVSGATLKNLNSATGNFVSDNRAVSIASMGAIFDVPTATAKLQCASVISGIGPLTKTGNGALILSEANTYTGITTVSGGTLGVANISGSATGFGGVDLLTGGRLTGAGRVSGRQRVDGGM